MPNARLASCRRSRRAAGVVCGFRRQPESAEPERAEQIWVQMLAREGLAVFVSDGDGRIVATCMLITAPNLLRGGRQHAQSSKTSSPIPLSRDAATVAL